MSSPVALRYKDQPGTPMFRLRAGEVSMPRINVTSSEFQADFGRWRDSAMREAITITDQEGSSLVLLSADAYRRLTEPDREVLHVWELSDREIGAIRDAEIPAAAAAFDHELEP